MRQYYIVYLNTLVLEVSDKIYKNFYKTQNTNRRADGKTKVNIKNWEED